jgi:hypothetical protein
LSCTQQQPAARRAPWSSSSRCGVVGQLNSWQTAVQAG